MKPTSLSRRYALAMMGIATTTLTAGCGGVSAATVPTARLFYTDTGAGRNVMVLHGWTCDSHDWSWQLPVLEKKYRVVAVDLRGHGRSDVMPPGSYQPEDYVADIENLIATRFPGQKFVLIGHSMGGQIAARLAVRRPDLVDAVVSVDGSLGFSTSLVPLFQKTVDDLNAGKPGDVAAALFQLFYDPATDPAYKRWQARRAQGTPEHVVRESFGPLFLGPRQVGVGDASAAFCKTVAVPLYHLCRDPVQADTMRSWFAHPKSKVETWTGAGHWIMLDRRADFNAAVPAWIDAL